MENSNTLLKMINIHRFYGQVHALKGVDFDLKKGEIHALVGTHRAGKSSLVNILGGVLRQDEGKIYLGNKDISNLSPKLSIKNKIGIIYQEPIHFPNLSTIESIFLNYILKKGLGWKSEKELIREVDIQCKKYDLSIEFKQKLEQNTQSEKNLVEILHVLMNDPEVLILDELSSRLTPLEMEKLYPILISFKERGKSIIYISHKMDEILRIADRVTVLHEGRKMGTEDIKNLNKRRLIQFTYSFNLTRQELEEQNLQLFYLKKYNEDILKNIPIGVIILNQYKEIYFSNQVALEILDIEIIDNSEDTFEEILEEKEFDDKKNLLNKINDKKYYTFDSIHYENNKILKIIVLPFCDETEVYLGTIILIEDITKDYNFINYLRQAERVASIAELAAGVAHEINNPLGIVHNYIELLSDTKLNNDQYQKLRNLENEVVRIANIVKSLLTFSKQSKLKFRKVDLIALLEDVILLLKHKITELKINIYIKKHIQMMDCFGDEGKLKQVFMNLIVNGIEAIHEDGIIIIDLFGDKEENFWVITIKDDGIGIPQSIRNQIFNPFFSTKENMSNAGLGLSICYNIMELHHGKIELESEEGKYTKFIVKIPKTIPDN